MFVLWLYWIGNIWCIGSECVHYSRLKVILQLHSHCCLLGVNLPHLCKQHETMCSSDATCYHGTPMHQTHTRSVCSHQNQKLSWLTCRVVPACCPCTRKNGWKSCCPGCLAFWATWRRLRRAVIMLQCRATPPLLLLTPHPSCWRATACSGESSFSKKVSIFGQSETVKAAGKSKDHRRQSKTAAAEFHCSIGCGAAQFCKWLHV